MLATIQGAVEGGYLPALNPSPNPLTKLIQQKNNQSGSELKMNQFDKGTST